MTTAGAFAFKAVRRDGTVETGTVEALTREAAVALVSSRGAFVMSVSPATETAERRAQVGADDLALGLRALATVLGSGIPLGRALLVLEELVPPAWVAILPGLRQRVEHGEPLGTALERSGLPLPPHVIGMIRAGEAGSGLAAATESAAQLLESRAATRSAIRNALAYPSILVIAGTASVTLLVTVVLPRFADLLVDAGQSLPFTTRMVLGLGGAAHVAFVPGLLTAAVALALWKTWVARPEGLSRWHELLLSAPVVGPVRRSAAAANACSALSALLGAGVPLPAALPHAARASGDRAIEQRMLLARRRIATGEGIASALRAEAALTPTVARLVRIGEETGRLADMLAHAARVEGNWALQRVRRLTRALEPAMILVFGALVMIVAAALLQAMYGLRPLER